MKRIWIKLYLEILDDAEFGELPEFMKWRASSALSARPSSFTRANSPACSGQSLTANSLARILFCAWLSSRNRRSPQALFQTLGLTMVIGMLRAPNTPWTTPALRPKLKAPACRGIEPTSSTAA